MVNGRRAKFYYLTQAAETPPTFVFFVSDVDRVKPSYAKYLKTVCADSSASKWPRSKSSSAPSHTPRKTELRDNDASGGQEALPLLDLTAGDDAPGPLDARPRQAATEDACRRAPRRVYQTGPGGMIPLSQVQGSARSGRVREGDAPRPPEAPLYRP